MFLLPITKNSSTLERAHQLSLLSHFRGPLVCWLFFSFFLRNFNAQFFICWYGRTELLSFIPKRSQPGPNSRLILASCCYDACPILTRTLTDSSRWHWVLMGIERVLVDNIANIGRCPSGLPLCSGEINIAYHRDFFHDILH